MKNLIEELIKTELERANEKFPQFHSRHEAYGVMLEELQEMLEETKYTEYGIEGDYWKACRFDKDFSERRTLDLLDCLEGTIVCLIKEAVQLAAMVQKAKRLEEAE